MHSRDAAGSRFFENRGCAAITDQQRNTHRRVRAKIMNAAGEVSLYVNPAQAPYTHKGLATVQVKQGSTYQEEESDYQHITTAIGYMTDFEFPIVKRVTTFAPLRI